MQEMAAREPLTQERILLAAVALADEGGIETLSMRKLGQQLGVEAMSIYNHVPNKDAILDGMVDMVAGEIAVPLENAVPPENAVPSEKTVPPENSGPADGVDWRTAMRRRAISAHAVLVRHPWASALIVSRVNVGPAMLRYVDSTIGVLRNAGFSYDLVDRAWNAMDSHIYGFTLQELNFPFEPDEYADVAAEYRPQLSAVDYPYLAELTELVMSKAHDGIANFEFGLDLILDGLERQLHRQVKREDQ
jgi:AcrR family transcriptional regulator